MHPLEGHQTGSHNGVWVHHPFHQTDHDLEGDRHQDSVYWDRSLSFSQVVEEPVVLFSAWLETFVLGIQT